MAYQALGQLEEVDVREVWPSESQDFTPWLAANLPLLESALGLDLIEVQQEAQIGAFFLDILATDGGGAMVAIENQLESTNHSHLGQLLTYAAGCDAHTLIWITPSFRDEHRAALDWLNRWTSEEINVYGVEVRAVRIGDSLPAPEFVPVVFPNEWSTRERIKLNPNGPKRRGFYQELVDRLREAGFTDKQRATSAWIQKFPAGVPDVTYNADIGNNPRVFVSMSDREMKQQVFDTLRSDHERVREIEEALGLEADPLTEIVWRTAPGNISVSRRGSGDNLTDEVRDWMFDYLIKFRRVFDQPVANIIDNLGTSND